MTRVGPVEPFRKPRDLVTDAPCRTALPRRPKPAWLSSTKDPSNDGKTITAIFQTRSAFHRRVHSAPLRANAWNESFAAATDASAWPPWLSFRHAFTRWFAR
jgi:hypothetical protein